MKSLAKKFLGYLIIAVSTIGIVYFFMVPANLFMTFVCTVTLILGVVLKFSATDEAYNKENRGIKRISDTHGISFEKLKQDFMDVETPLGKPWIGQAALNVKDSLVYGPTQRNEYLYIYYKKGKCYISSIGMENIKNSKSEGENTFGATLKTYNFAGKSVVESGYATVMNYFETGTVSWQDDVYHQNQEY